ncbi:oxidoreductase, 2OG-Fe(II) oxygenase family protein [Necator americanus]|uniref:procollagen-proline 4-dioxygenase n=1 Tax=Necator americanus TaxID=51031 RepID=W2TGQ8_NECAM|nr:oxidoreductase, 2OG-Fe(II) oxygenase family protein [Necator americanus]ETN81225.1 oxidoreductase, 2OG-Fe(II) oxygenase family protein [Necator americanus]
MPRSEVRSHNAQSKKLSKGWTPQTIRYRIPRIRNVDLTGAAIGLLRLQDTYRLDTRDLAQGRILEVQGNFSLNAGDCFDIAKAAYNEGDHYHVVMWMEEARRRLHHETVKTADLEQVLEYLSYSLYKQGNLKHSLQLVEELFAMNPDHPRAKGNIKWYEDLLKQEGVKTADMRRSLGRIRNDRPDSVLGNRERTIYEALCRSEVPVVEIKRFNPLAVLFKEVMSDEEIEVIEQLSVPKLNRATVHDSATGKLVHATYRISKSAWLKSWEHEVVERINKRIDMMTNLEMETAEELQVQNYGVGGHYDPHFDHARKEETESFKTLGTGNRVATVLFYMTEPRYGGGTVFTEVKSTVLPTKNDALFWYNLHKYGDGNVLTRHAACPVLLGEKWVTNKWIHERGNEFRRPCALKMSENERFVGDLGIGPEPRNSPNLSPDLSKDIFNTI